MSITSPRPMERLETRISREGWAVYDKMLSRRVSPFVKTKTEAAIWLLEHGQGYLDIAPRSAKA